MGEFDYLKDYKPEKITDSGGFEAFRAKGRCMVNKALIEAFRFHSSPDYEVRKHSVPMVFFRRVGRDGKVKGYVQFQGFGVVHQVELVTQYDRRNDRTFSNFAFDFIVLSLAAGNELFDWKWIAARRDPSTIPFAQY